MSFLFRAAAVMACAVMPELAPATPLSFERALAAAAERSEAALAARAAESGARELLRAAGQLPDPRLRVGMENVPLSGQDSFSGRDRMTMKRIGISQEWVSADKRNAREDTARAMARREAARAAAARADARMRAALAYVESWHAAAAERLLVRMQDHFREEVQVAVARLAAAGGSGADTLRLRAAWGEADDEREAAAQQHAAALVALQRWVGFVPDTVEVPPALGIPSEQDYLARHPRLAQLRRDVDVAEANASVAALDRRPNWTWEAAYAQRSGYPDLATVAVNVPLQLWPTERQDRQAAARVAQADEARALYAEAVREAQAEYRAASSDAARLRQRLQRYRDVVVQAARQRTAAAMAGYRSAQMPLAAVFEARHMEIEVQRKQLALRRDLFKAEAQLALKPLEREEAL